MALSTTRGNVHHARSEHLGHVARSALAPFAGDFAATVEHAAATRKTIVEHQRASFVHVKSTFAAEKGTLRRAAMVWRGAVAAAMMAVAFARFYPDYHVPLPEWSKKEVPYDAARRP